MMKNLFLKLSSIFIITLFIVGFKPAPNGVEVIKSGDTYYLSNTIVVKLKSQPVVNSGTGEVLLSKNFKQSIEQFKFRKSKVLFNSKTGEAGKNLSRIISIEYGSESDPKYVASKVKSLNGVEWAEPKFVYPVDFTPNDPSFGNQWNLTQIDAETAWDTNKGDTSVVIGIVDTGVDWDHPDLNANIWINHDEIPGNGVDDDNNGFVDDIRGWDFGGLTGTPDNDPMEDRPDHGTHVAGISSAVTDNNTGIAAIGFNSKIMAIKVTQDDERGPNGPYILYGYEGIVYAADNGAKVINCSWGGAGFSLLGQETINYATENGSLVVAAAGNSNSSVDHYPSGYDKVISVASTTQSDTKSGFSNYGKTIDVSAPGSSIYSTWQNNTYTYLSGTSMASPLAAGTAALIWAQYPDFTPLQVGEQLRVTSDDITDQNPSYEYLLGKGRINADESLRDLSAISVRAIDIEFTDEAPGGDGDGVLEPGEVISVGINFKNYLNPTSNLVITLESDNNYSAVINGTFNAGSVNELEEFDNYSNKFTFHLDEETPENSDLPFLIKFSDSDYDDYQWTGVVGNPTYATQEANDVALTITSKGTLAFNDYPDNTQGEGFVFNDDGENLLFEGALILGTDAEHISDAARGSDQSVQNTDFSVIQPFILNTPGTLADQQGSAIYNDENAGSNRLGVTVDFNSYSFVDEPYNNIIILHYKISNNSQSDLENFHAALYYDWDIPEAFYDQNITQWEDVGKFSYTYDNTSNTETKIGTALISQEDYVFWAIQNDGADGGINVYDGFTDQEKWQTLSNRIGDSEAGPADISHVIGGGEFTIPGNGSIDVAFAIVAGTTLQEVADAVDDARIKYSNILTDVEDDENQVPVKFNLSQNYPNPFNPSTTIKYSVAKESNVTLKIYDVLGKEVAELVNKNQKPGNYNINFDATQLASGIYFYKISAGNFTSVKKMMLMK